jgi:hypothetical protein
VTVQRAADGTATVQVCAGVRHGLPVGVFARHVGVSTARLRIDVALKSTGNIDFSDGVVEVFPDEKGTVHIRPIPDVTHF